MLAEGTRPFWLSFVLGHHQTSELSVKPREKKNSIKTNLNTYRSPLDSKPTLSSNPSLGFILQDCLYGTTNED